MGRIEARHLRDILEIRKIDPKSLMYLLRNAGWALDILEKETQITERKAVFRVTKCGTQLTRIKKGLKVFPCKRVRFGYLRSFAHELDAKIEVICKVCRQTRDRQTYGANGNSRFRENKRRHYFCHIFRT